MEDIRNIQGRKAGVDEKTREVIFESSNTTKDRHRTVLNQDNWKLDNFNANGIIGYQHNVYGNEMCEKPTPDDIIGKGRAWTEDGRLMTSIQFKPEGRSALADKVYEDVRDGYLNAVSVGFSPFGKGRLIDDETGKERDFRGGIPDGHTYYFEGQELLEVSVVNIPSNPTALKKSFRDSTASALMYLVRAFNGKYSLADIDKMTVGSILKLLNDDNIELHYDDEPAIRQDAEDQKEIEELERLREIEADRAERDRFLRRIDF